MSTDLASMLKLYGGAPSRASIVRWYLEEVGVPYEFVKLDLQAGEHRQPEYLTINPIGKVPAIVDGDLQLWESGANLLYLAEKRQSHLLRTEGYISPVGIICQCHFEPRNFCGSKPRSRITSTNGSPE